LPRSEKFDPAPGHVALICAALQEPRVGNGQLVACSKDDVNAAVAALPLP